jgi:hypothetical protein
MMFFIWLRLGRGLIKKRTIFQGLGKAGLIKKRTIFQGLGKAGLIKKRKIIQGLGKTNDAQDYFMMFLID